MQTLSETAFHRVYNGPLNQIKLSDFLRESGSVSAAVSCRAKPPHIVQIIDHDDQIHFVLEIQIDIKLINMMTSYRLTSCSHG